MRVDADDFARPCSCGREHHIDVKEIVIESGAIGKLEEEMSDGDLREYISPLLICDTNSYKATEELMEDIYDRCQVLIHAIMDALLGAAALGDIGKHFPDTDPAYKGISSVKLLVHVAGLLKENGYAVGNIDATIIAQKPKMAPHIPEMRENIAKALGIEISQLNIKATTEEGLGFTGQGEGISSQAICSLYRIGKLEE